MLGYHPPIGANLPCFFYFFYQKKIISYYTTKRTFSSLWNERDLDYPLTMCWSFFAFHSSRWNMWLWARGERVEKDVLLSVQENFNEQLQRRLTAKPKLSHNGNNGSTQWLYELGGQNKGKLVSDVDIWTWRIQEQKQGNRDYTFSFCIFPFLDTDSICCFSMYI